jgi:TetR/AcrR family transcriptional regulator, transcriptional repressor for nem operon
MRTESRRRNPDRTRERLLDAGFGEIYAHGFQAAGLDAIVERAQVTKGALYHHFPSKHALGYAVFDEVIGRYTDVRWLYPIRGAADPLTAIADSMREAFKSEFQHGCPLNNLAQEMSSVDEGFHDRIAALYRHWESGVAVALAGGQERGTVDPAVNVNEAATFIVASIEGAYSLAKGRQDRGPLMACLAGTTRYLESLRRRSNESNDR